MPCFAERLPWTESVGAAWARMCLLGALLVPLFVAMASQGVTADNGTGAAGKIRHVVIIMQENRSFDQYFGTYPGADGTLMNGGRPRVCVRVAYNSRCVKPFHDRHDLNLGGPHSAGAFRRDLDHGQMDGFVREERAYLRSCNKKVIRACAFADNPPDVMGYHDGRDIPNYWAYASQYVLQDHMFASAASWSLPNHLYLVSDWSARCRIPGQAASCHSDPVNPPASWTGGHQDARKPGSPDYAWTDLTYLLHRQAVSWRYFVAEGNQPDCANGAQACARVAQRAATPGFWNPLPFFDTVRSDHQLGSVQPLSRFYLAARKGSLPAVSWIVPSEAVSEHPTELISTGQSHVTHVIDTIMRSPNWKSTAIFLSWDDWGGFFDHVTPPTIQGTRLGFRVPGLVISAYARHGFVDHQVLSFDSYLRFIEDTFLHGQRLDPATDGRPDPRPSVRDMSSQLGDLAADFDFSRPPRAPFLLPEHPTTDLTKRAHQPSAPPLAWSNSP